MAAQAGAGQPRPEIAPPARLRVLMATARYFPDTGGVETHVYEVARRLVRRGLDVTVLVTDLSGRRPREEEVEGVQIQRVRAWPARRDYYFAPGLARIIAQGQWDLVHCQGIHTLVAPLAMLAAWRARRPYVVTFHTGGHSSRLRQALRGLQWALLRPLLAGAERLIGVSAFEAELFRQGLRLPRAQFAVIPNGASLADRAPAAAREADQTLIVSVGRLEQYKGHHRVLAALPRLQGRCPDVRLRIVGSGPYEGALRRMAHDLGVADRVEIGAVPPGDRQGMAAVLSQAALVTLLSDYEAHPVAVMEALALRRPVLVADTSGLRELAQRGLVRAVPLASTTEQIASAVLDQLGQPSAPEVAQLPTWDDCAAQLLALYQTAVRRPRCVS